jgi:hypothetical protein
MHGTANLRGSEGIFERAGEFFVGRTDGGDDIPEGPPDEVLDGPFATKVEAIDAWEPFYVERHGHERWVSMMGDRQWRRSCRECGETFDPPKVDTDICQSCWWNLRSNDAEGRFASFAEAITARTGLATEVWHTGGNIWCMAIVFERNDDGRAVRYLLTSDPDDVETWEFGLYDETVEESSEGLMLAGSWLRVDASDRAPAATPDQVADEVGRIARFLRVPIDES